mgnify:CR=1 FL=1|jgi:hypothetical protein
MAATNVSVTTSATSIISASDKKRRTGLIIRNNEASATVFLGEDNTVTTSNGYPLLAGTELKLENNGGSYQFLYRGAVFGIVASGTGDIRVWEFLEYRA